MRLPGGATTRFSFGEDEGRLGEYAWYTSNSGGSTHRVKQLKSNVWNLFDTHGNVWEWCQDWYGAYPATAVADPAGPSSGVYRVFRGGSWDDDPPDVRCAARGGLGPGFWVNSLAFALPGAREVCLPGVSLSKSGIHALWSGAEARYGEDTKFGLFSMSGFKLGVLVFLARDAEGKSLFIPMKRFGASISSLVRQPAMSAGGSLRIDWCMREWQ